ncbi:hypothetical protein MUK42_33203 [Musa troglodytarum]|nr:hypothetical protein MUK42_33203 [Musa troglodytarum]
MTRALGAREEAWSASNRAMRLVIPSPSASPTTLPWWLVDDFEMWWVSVVCDPQLSRAVMPVRSSRLCEPSDHNDVKVVIENIPSQIQRKRDKSSSCKPSRND